MVAMKRFEEELWQPFPCQIRCLILMFVFEIYPSRVYGSKDALISALFCAWNFCALPHLCTYVAFCALDLRRFYASDKTPVLQLGPNYWNVQVDDFSYI
jgi:hypothetical protein